MLCKVMINKQKTGEIIRRQIQRLGVSYDDLAEKLELASARVIYEWVNGHKMPSIENLINLSIQFQSKLEDILVVEGIL